MKKLKIPEDGKVELWMMDEARFGLHTEMRRLWARKGKRPAVNRQIKYEWNYRYLEDLARTEPEAVHVVIREQAGFHLRDGDTRLPERIRIIDLPPYNPELNPCEKL